jgi:hypothetical protein
MKTPTLAKPTIKTELTLITPELAPGVVGQA